MSLEAEYAGFTETCPVCGQEERRRMDKAQEDALIRIATIYLQVPGQAAQKYIPKKEWIELLSCYQKVRQLVPKQEKLAFKENNAN